LFTGLIREIGKLRGRSRRAGVMRLDIEAANTAATANLGDSIAVNGICLTVTACKGSVFSVEAASETRNLTTLTTWRSGQQLHLEPALRAGDALDGHLVQGHVDGTGRVLAVKRDGGGLLVTVGLPPELARFLTPKGSVAVDGVSLTVDAGPFRDRFTVNLIPHTLAATSFQRLRAGRQVNLEMDVLVKAARTGQSLASLPAWAGEQPATRPAGKSLTVEELQAKGFRRRGARGPGGSR